MYIETVYIINHKRDTGNLDLWPSKLKNIRDRVLTKTNQHVEYKSNVINSNEQKTCLHCFYKSDHCDIDLWPSEPKIIRSLVLTKSN